MAYQRIKLKNGVKANLPTSNMLVGEPHFTTDRGTLHVATDATHKLPLVPAIDDLTAIGAINLAEDLLIVHNADGTGQKEQKVTVADFKAALNIPAASTDEKVAVVPGGTAGYLFGTDGSDGVIRAGSSMQITKDASNGYITIEANIIDGGTF